MASKFEQKFGKYAIKNLTLFLIAGYVVGYLIYYINGDLYALLTFDPYQILHGQVWRLVTWLITMPESLGIFTIIMLFLYYSLGRTLEKTWGSYRYNVYLFSGFLFTIVGAFILYFVLSKSKNKNLSLRKYYYYNKKCHICLLNRYNFPEKLN